MSAEDQAAKSLSDDLFKDDPEIIYLKKKYEAALKRMDIIKASDGERFALLKKAEGANHDSRQKLSYAKTAMLKEVLNGVADGDFGFKRALDLMVTIEELEDHVRASAMAVDFLKRRDVAITALDMLENDVTRARNQLGGTLMAKKRAYLREHPDALAA